MWTRLLGQAVLPLNVALEAFVLAALLRRLRWRRSALACALLGVTVLWAASTPVVANAALAGLERRVPPVSVERSPGADAIVVLGGMLGPPLPPRLEADLGAGADRLLHAGRLFRAGKAPLVLVSGGYAECGEGGTSEARCAADLLVEWGVPASAILVEGASYDTHENAVKSAALLRSRGSSRILLVTSAAHMTRAAGAFRATGIDVVPSPTDFLALEGPSSFALWIPSAEALAATTAAVHEGVGLLYYRWRGWLD